MLLCGALVACALDEQYVVATVVEIADDGVWVRYGALVVKVPCSAVCAPEDEELAEEVLGLMWEAADVQYIGTLAAAEVEYVKTEAAPDVQYMGTVAAPIVVVG